MLGGGAGRETSSPAPSGGAADQSTELSRSRTGVVMARGGYGAAWRLAYADDGRPVEMCDAQAAADRYELVYRVLAE